MNKLIRYSAIGILFLYVASCTTLFTFQKNFLYFPTAEIERSDVEKFQLSNQDISLNVWKVASDNRKAIIYFGGNAEPVSNNIDPFRVYLSGYDIYLLSYRGYGGSDGKPSETGFYDDAIKLYDFVSTDYDSVSIIGRSLWSGVATYVASQRPTERLALITPYDSIENVAQEKFPFFPVSLLLTEKYNSVGRAHLISAPTLIVTAEHDRVIPARRTMPLSDAIDPRLLTRTIIKDTNHLTVSRPQSFWDVFSDFFEAQEI